MMMKKNRYVLVMIVVTNDAYDNADDIDGFDIVKYNQ